MEFGHLPVEALQAVNFSLPPDSGFTLDTLRGLIKKKPLIYVGCAKWGRKEWVGKIYPERTKEIDFLSCYVKNYNSIELNATHYKIQPPSVIANWASKAAGRDFKFCPKIPQSISHYSTLVSPQAQQSTDKFIQGIIAFKEFLGPVFLQVSDKFSPAKKDNLVSYLESLPKDIDFFVEVRHAQWFADREVRDDFFNVLRRLKIGAVITDTAGRRDCVHMELPFHKAFIRFVGNNLDPSDFTRIDEWVARIRQWLDMGLQEVYFFMHQPDERFSPELCDYAAGQMNIHCNAGLIRPVFLKREMWEGGN